MRIIYFLSIASLALTFTACHRNNNDSNVLGQTYVHKYGVAVPSDFWSASGEHGSVISTMADGVVITRSYTSGVLDGDTTYSFPHNSQIQKIETYNQGTLVKTTEYYYDGSSQSQIVYDSSRGIRTVSTWYMGGTPRSTEQYSGDALVSGQYFSIQNHNDAGVDNYQGTRIVRDDYGQIISTDNIVDGQLTLQSTYHTNGNPKATIPYQNGVVHGTKQTYHPGGEPDTIEAWSAGKQEGNTVVYQYGEKYADVPYVDGQKHGVESRYRDGQDMVQEVSWNKGQQHGPATTYVGNASKTDWYFNGNPVSKNQYDFLNNRAQK